LAITPYYASLIRTLDASDPVFRMSVPDASELNDPPFLLDDPLSEDRHMPVHGLVHRYGDRALLLATTACGSYCRHCTRKRVAGQSETCLSSIRLAQATEYLSVHPEIHDVIISGGDPFTMRTEVLERVIKAVRAVPSVDIIRIGTRTPVVMPMRITDELVTMLKAYHPIYVNTHFNHPVELTPDAQAACARLVDAGVPMGNQTVLLRGVNDDPQLLTELFRRLTRARVRPYYLYQCDLVRGVEHFRTPLTKGIEIMEYVRGRLSGLAIPNFVVDAPHGGGKIPLLPNYVVSQSPTHTVLRNYAGELVSYPEPQGDVLTFAAQPSGAARHGVWELASGRAVRLGPTEDAARPSRPRSTGRREGHDPAPMPVSIGELL
jgi:lysine 2,3-aminomutase